MRVLINVAGARGAAQLSVPVPSAARSMLTMPPALGALLLMLAIGLAIGAISIVGGAARESRLTPGAPAAARTQTARPTRDGDNGRPRGSDLLFCIFVVELRRAGLRGDYNPVQAAQAVAHPCRWKFASRLRPSPTDHGLAAVQGYGFHRAGPRPSDASVSRSHARASDRIWHLHPATANPMAHSSRRSRSLAPGLYSAFADIVSQNGFPWTLVGSINLPQINGAPLSGDDSAGEAPPLTSSSDSTVDVLADGTRVTWHRESAAPRANVPMILRFEVQDQSGKPASDLQPYMGMAAHAEIVSSDLQVFAHIHPSGSVPMAALMMASTDSMAGMDMNASATAAASTSPNLSMPYGFPRPGRYRIFLQFKRAGKIETAYFDTAVN